MNIIPLYERVWGFRRGSYGARALCLGKWGVEYSRLYTAVRRLLPVL
jgi:hypothetical protein